MQSVQIDSKMKRDVILIYVKKVGKICYMHRLSEAAQEK